jgi:hypothetical protein
MHEETEKLLLSSNDAAEPARQCKAVQAKAAARGLMSQSFRREMSFVAIMR